MLRVALLVFNKDIATFSFEIKGGVRDGEVHYVRAITDCDFEYLVDTADRFDISFGEFKRGGKAVKS